MQDYVAPRGLVARSCSASGNKFHDLDADGQRDSGEPGLPGGSSGPTTTTTAFGTMASRSGSRMPKVITSSTTSVRETGPTCFARPLRRTGAPSRAPCRRRVQLPERRHDRRDRLRARGLFHCGWGPIESARTSYARFKDFGNYVPATLVVEKQLEPSSDPGRFDLLVNQTVVIAGAGDGAVRGSSQARRLHGLGRAAVGTNPANYRSTVECKVGTRRTQVRSGGVYATSAPVRTAGGLHLPQRPPRLARDRDRQGGACQRDSGDTLRYQLFVSNPGDLPFPAASVRVVDPNCDPQPPALVGKADAPGADDTPRTLDPGDIWTYSCSKKTVAPEDCRPSVVTNTAVVTGEADGSRVRDDSRVDTASLAPPSLPSLSSHLRRHRQLRRPRLRRPLCHRGRRRRTPTLQRPPVRPSVRPSPGAFAAGLRESTSRAHGSHASACS